VYKTGGYHQKKTGEDDAAQREEKGAAVTGNPVGQAAQSQPGIKPS
jgi:hypothetical protein